MWGFYHANPPRATISKAWFHQWWKTITLKTPPGQIWPGKGSHGARPISGSDLSGIRVNISGIWVQNVFLTRIPGQSDSDSGSVWPGFPGRSDPKMGLAPLRLFSGSNLTRELYCLYITTRILYAQLLCWNWLLYWFPLLFLGSQILMKPEWKE